MTAGHFAANAVAEQRIREGSPIILMYLHPGTGRDGVVVPDVAFLTEGSPLRVTRNDVIEIDCDAPVERRRTINHYRESRGLPGIDGLEEEDWLDRLRQLLADATASPRDRRRRNGAEVVIR